MGVEGDGGIVSAIAVILQGIYSILGLVVGIIFLGVGLILLLGGIGGSSHFVAEILGGKFEISDATAGLVCAVLGSIIIWVSRFNVFIHSK
jgi:hypothetical protein